MGMIDDIIAEMRKDMPRVVDTKVILRNYADRIEAAAKVGVAKMETTTQSVTDCNHLEAVDIESRCIYGAALETNETVADVIDSLDGCAEEYLKCGDASPLIYTGLKIIVTRLRRAHGKEVEEFAKANRYEICNMQKMRGALLKMRYFVDEMKSSQTPISYGEYFWAVETIDKALSAPPRNCDRFGSWREANAEWWKYEVLPRVEGVVSGEEQPFEEWLFAEAKGEKK